MEAARWGSSSPADCGAHFSCSWGRGLLRCWMAGDRKGESWVGPSGASCWGGCLGGLSWSVCPQGSLLIISQCCLALAALGGGWKQRDQPFMAEDKNLFSCFRERERSPRDKEAIANTSPLRAAGLAAAACQVQCPRETQPHSPPSSLEIVGCRAHPLGACESRGN